jgi:hypothetical protein
MEEAIDSYPVLSYMKLNRGDANLIDEFDSRKRLVLFKFVASSVFAVALGIISSRLEKLL